MPRRATDPVERAFAAWASLTTEDQQRFEDRRAGYRAAMQIDIPTPKPRRKRKEVAAGGDAQ